ncbi:Lhr-like helicase [Cenarchaeum symbiosum A]|uniref:Lhr-like helicase n=1 Tax=Cenarchaeum symbiosum (strain A) TaxID=414004 RepID=A0RYZ4_CENSY|nr:Lhr-like helicase [Cenarchaeum symbiosum A]
MRGPDRGKKTRLDPVLAARFASLGFESLTEIQARASPVIYQKRDTLVIAPTGSGKTECSVIPVFSRLSRREGRTRALYITPLRALNRDVFRRITSYAEAEGLTIGIRHGDTTQKERKKISENPPDVLITTPETLVILLTQKKMLDALSELEWVIIDEVHELLASERGSQLSLSLERLAVNSSREITRIGLSATVGNIADAAKFVSGARRKCRVVRDRSVRRYEVEVRYVDGSISDVAGEVASYVRDQGIDTPVLLFTNSRGEAELMASILRENSDIPIQLHHGSLSREVHEETEGSLKEGKFGIVVCTSSLELGLDIGSVELVIHYGSPRQVSKLVQRIGRSRHSRGSSARGLVITNSPDDECEARAILERIAEGSIEDQAIHRGSADVLAHHLVGLVIQLGEVAVPRVLEIFRGAYPFRDLDLEGLCAVLELLDSNRLIYFDRANMSIQRSGRSFTYYYENLSTIPDILRFRVFDSVGKKVIGSLDQRFVGDYGEQGNVFVLRGLKWRILNIDEKSLFVNVEPLMSGGVNVPYWEGETIPVDRSTSGKVGRFRARARRGEIQLASDVMAKLPFAEPPDDSTIVAESSRVAGTVVLHACLGTKVNATLSTLLSSMLSSMLGFAVESRSDAYRIALTSNSRLTKGLIDSVLHDTYDLSDVVAGSIAGTHNVNWRTWCVGKKFGIVDRRAVYERRSARFLYERYKGTPVVDEALRELFHDRYDLEGTDAVLSEIREGRIRLLWEEVDRFSKLAGPILDHTTKYYAAPASLDQGIVNLVKKRLSKTVHRLICARCGKWERTYEADKVPESLRCPYCRGKQITSTFQSDHDLSALIRKKHGGGKVTKDERRRLDRAWKASSLIESFGNDAITALSGYGVGADTAARILRDMVGDEDLFRRIYEAERNYVMTRGFWD